LVFTGSTGDSVQQGSIQCQQYVSTNPGKLQDLAYTLGVRRQHYSYRSFAVADGINTPTFSSPSKTPKLTPKIVYVFTGQGAQWATMGMSLISDYPSVLHDMAQMDNALSELTEPPSWKISGES
jgi:acyl transferase domain-containing protein